MEREKESSEEKGEGGFSEKELDLDIEIRAGEWQNLKKFRTYQRRSRQGKIIATHQALSNRLAQLEKLFYQLASNNPQKATKLLKEIKRLRFLKEFLLHALIWEEKGELEDHEVPSELESLFK